MIDSPRIMVVRNYAENIHRAEITIGGLSPKQLGTVQTIVEGMAKEEIPVQCTKCDDTGYYRGDRCWCCKTDRRKRNVPTALYADKAISDGGNLISIYLFSSISPWRPDRRNHIANDN